MGDTPVDLLIREFFNIEVMVRVWPLLWRGLLQTLLLAVLIVPLGLTGGLLVSFATTSRRAWLRRLGSAYVDLFRAFPPLMLLILVYSGLPFAGIRLDTTVSVCLAFLLHSSSYYGEIYRAGIESVSAGQREAARSTGLSWWQAMLYVVLPQGVRNVLPELASNTIELIKLTTLASVISAPELLHSADLARSLTYNASPLMLVALIYLLLLWPAVALSRRLDNKIQVLLR